MKKKILLSSALSSVLATVIAISAILNTDNAKTLVLSAKWYSVSGTLGLLGIALFFVGLVFPKE